MYRTWLIYAHWQHLSVSSITLRHKNDEPAPSFNFRDRETLLPILTIVPLVLMLVAQMVLAPIFKMKLVKIQAYIQIAIYIAVIVTITIVSIAA